MALESGAPGAPSDGDRAGPAGSRCLGAGAWRLLARLAREFAARPARQARSRARDVGWPFARRRRGDAVRLHVSRTNGAAGARLPRGSGTNRAPAAAGGDTSRLGAGD